MMGADDSLSRGLTESEADWLERVFAALVEFNKLRQELEEKGAIPKNHPSWHDWPPTFTIQ